MVEDAGVDLSFVLVPGPVETIVPEDGGPPQEVSSPILIPDLTQPLPLEGLVALVQRSIQLGGQGSASTPIPILDLVDRTRAFEIVEESYALPSVRVNEVPVREYVYRRTAQPHSGLHGSDSCAGRPMTIAPTATRIQMSEWG